MDNVSSYVERLRAALDALPRDELAELGDMLYRAYVNGKQVFVLGNGGSASTASHMAADLSKNTVVGPVRRFRVISLNDNISLVTALANDVGYEHVFSVQLETLARAGDLVIVLSGSGNSRNVLNAMQAARGQSAQVVAVLGCGGGDARALADIAIVIPSDHYGIVEDLHLVINHILVEHFQSRLVEQAAWIVS